MNKVLISGYSRSSKSSLQVGNHQIFENNPSFCCVYEQLLFTLNETGGVGKVLMYTMESKQLKLLDQLTLEGGGMCHLSYSPKHRILFGACYETGHIFSIEVLEDRLGKVRTFLRLEPLEGDNISRAHCVQMDPKEQFLYAINIHTDGIYCFKLINGELRPNEAFESLQLPKGNGPRHITFHPQLPIAYIITEYSNVIFVVKQNQQTGELTLIQEISTLPSGYMGESYGSTCIISPNGRYLYAANRGHNSIALFRIRGNGMLEYVKTTDCEGDWPRHIACTKDGKNLMICNQRLDEVIIIGINEDTGALENVVERIIFNEPSFVQEVILND